MFRIAVPKLEDARQNRAHRSEIQRLLTFVETLQIVPQVLACFLGKATDDILRVPKPTNVKGCSGLSDILPEVPDYAPVVLSELSEDDPPRKSPRKHDAHAEV